MVRWPSISGTSHMPMASITGTETRNSMVEPCRLKASLNTCGFIRFMSGKDSCRRMSIASQPARNSRARVVQT